MRTRDAFSDLFEERVLDLDKLSRLDHVEYLLDLPEEHHLQHDDSHQQGLNAACSHHVSRDIFDIIQQKGNFLKMLKYICD